MTMDLARKARTTTHVVEHDAKDATVVAAIPPPGHQASDNDAGGGGAAGVEAHRKVRGAAWAFIVVALISSTFLYALDNTVIATVRPSMIESLGHIELLPWISAAYPMTETGSNPFWGKVNNLFDNKWLYLISLAVFEVGSAIIGAAPVTEAVIVGRTIAGIGGSGIYVGTINIVSAMTTPTERTVYLNHVGIAWGLGAVLGPLVGGAFAASSATWRWAFYINLVIAAAAAPALFWYIPPVVPPRAKGPVLRRIGQIDYVGAALFLAGVFCIVAILGFGGLLYPWGSGRMIALYVSAAVVWLAFSVQQKLCLFTTDRIFPLQFVGNLDMVLLFCWTAIAISNVTVTIYTLPLLFQFAYDDTPLQAALWTLPLIGAMLVLGGPLGPVFPKFPFYKLWYAVASVIMLVAAGLMTTIRYDTTRGAMCGFMVLQGCGVGMIIQLGFTVGQVKVPRRLVGDVSAFMTCAQMSSLAIALGISTSVLIIQSTQEISAAYPQLPHSVIEATINGVRSDVFEELGRDTRVAIAKIVVRNVGRVFYLNVAGAGLGFCCMLPMKLERADLTVKALDDGHEEEVSPSS
ncbi:major facilitator superfamily domain-containing protein [Stachybotrys elegans]|uniref:Major facilitator superfamily domain-containing protein n=1 Tax=Stachybotrys elegans TaxID=80388 RepID=A0A8K0SD94_9HYPO|nr:major facilitator superfamily domain-containing protein [Stachybotrys elegans]